jgi:STE24 endopeptidase
LWTGFYLLLRLFPRRWPIPGGALLIIVSFTFTLLTPLLITPLYYEVEPLADENLRARILSLAERAGLSADEVYVIDASAKTTLVNAYVTGFGNAQRIMLYDTLLADYTPDQVEVVLAHELGHWYYRHVLLGLLGLGAAGWIGLFGLRWLLERSWQPLGLRGPADVAGLPHILTVLAIATTLLLPIENNFSRYGENQADEFALAASQKPDVFIELFVQLAEQNLSRVDAPAWEKFIFHTHPTTTERVRHAEKFQNQLTSRD